MYDRYKTLAVDFDATISQYAGWKGLGKFGPIFPGCIGELQKVRDNGWKIVIWTTRGDDIDDVKKFLIDNKVPFDYINENVPGSPENLSKKKIIASVYLDDRAINFDGDWSGMANRILGFRTHYQQAASGQQAEDYPDKELYESIASKILPYDDRLRSYNNSGISLYDAYMPHLSHTLSTDFFSPAAVSITEDLLLSLAGCVPGYERKVAKDIFKERNTARGGLWKDAGMVGALIEIHAKLARIKQNHSSSDSYVDLFNYCIIALMCIELNMIKVKGPVKNSILITGADGSLGSWLCNVFMLNGFDVVKAPGLVSIGEINNYLQTLMHNHKPFGYFINNHGVNHLNWIGKLTSDDYNVIDVNLKAPLAWVDGLIKGNLLVSEMEPRILNISSQTYRIAQRCTSAYCASKAGLSHLTKVMARELAPQGFVVNALAPGKIEDTRMSELTDAQVNLLRGWKSESANKYATSLVPAGRFTDCEEVAMAAIKIMHLPSYINGSVIDMTGGQ
jgi:NAD(P)-dependent dehydrogenase (short-subunit alcohol dehydrogenase family)